MLSILLEALELGLSWGEFAGRLLASSPDLCSHDISRASPVNQDGASVQFISLLVQVLLHRVHVVANVPQTFIVDRFFGASCPSVG